MRQYLIVDDNRQFAENVAEILSDGSATVTVADNPAAALDLVQRRRFDALITDMRMPVMNGAELVHAIRGVDRGLPAIVVTAYSQDTDLEDARHEGLLAVLPKPVPIPQLGALLKAARRGGPVVVVEDDGLLCDTVCEALRARGLTVVTAHSALEAERLGSLVPFAAVADWKGPESPAGEALERLAAKYPGLPLLVVTARAGLVPPALAAKVFVRPLDAAALLAEVERLFSAEAPA